MIVEQYHTVANPRPVNALQQLQVRRNEARREADKARRHLKQGVHDMLHPRPVARKATMVGKLLANAQTIATGVMVGSKIVSAIRAITRKR